ncbi:MAG TPA: VWA domain-containing protein [Vicinamibacterales bacterium]|jgi:Ca-activated chloride channel family protein|nr:VWA domain-containing protein [Vicinamibacterales bacterium]
MRFLHPGLAWWLIGALPAIWLLRWTAHRRLGTASTVPWVFARAHRASWIRRLPAGVLLLGLILLGAALLDPVIPYSEAEVQSHGLDIVIALDLSSSMQEQMERTPPPRTLQNLTFTNQDARVVARPPGKTRLEATKDAIKAFVRRRRDDRVGLVVFSDNAYVVSPLTFDHEYLVRYIDLVDDQILRGEGMTAIGEGLALSDYLLSRQSASGGRRNQVVVLFTDGENNTGREPIEVLKEADAANIRVHMVGVALEEEIRKKPQVQRLLQAIRGYGGRYFNADTVRDLEAASRAIDAAEKGVLVSRTYLRDTPVYQWFAIPALVCLALAMGLRAIPVFIDQT